MSNVLTFTPRPRPAVLTSAPPIAGPDLRTRLEEAAQSALDVADRIIAALDQIDGDADLEPDADAEPSLAAPEGHALQIGWCRGGDQDREADAPGAALPIVEVPEADPVPLVIVPEALPWYGTGNVVSFVGITLLSLVTRS